jgi:hypothetical protein
MTKFHAFRGHDFFVNAEKFKGIPTKQLHNTLHYEVSCLAGLFLVSLSPESLFVFICAAINFCREPRFKTLGQRHISANLRKK